MSHIPFMFLSLSPQFCRPAAKAATASLTPVLFALHRPRTSMFTAEGNSARTIRTAACLVIGDEVLGGKTRDTNSNYMAGFCFSTGIQLKRIEVIEDDESEIIEAVRRMSQRYDFVVTSGGIGPTHDDITYQSIAKAFGLKIKLYDEAYQRMRKLSRHYSSLPAFNWDEDSPAKKAKLRMVELPTDDSIPAEKQFIFPHDDLWVPVAVANGNVHILPGVPRLFERLLDGLKPIISPRLVDPEGHGIQRILISTPMTESAVAKYLSELAAKVESRGVKVGSYPRWEKKRNTVTLVGKDRAFLDSIKDEVAENVRGRIVQVEGEDDDLPSDG